MSEAHRSTSSSSSSTATTHSSIIPSLPATTETIDEDTCSICLLPLFTLGDSVVALPCGHVLHRDCSSGLVTAMLRPLTAEDHMRGIRKQELGCPLCRTKFAARDILKLHLDLRAFIGATLIGSTSYQEEQNTKLSNKQSLNTTTVLQSDSVGSNSASYNQLKLNHAHMERELAISKRNYSALEAEYQSLKTQLQEEQLLRKETESSTSILRQQLNDIMNHINQIKKDKERLQLLLTATQRELESTIKERNKLNDRILISNYIEDGNLDPLRNEIKKNLRRSSQALNMDSTYANIYEQEYEKIVVALQLRIEKIEKSLVKAEEQEKKALTDKLDIELKCNKLESELNRLDKLNLRQDRELKQLRNNQHSLTAFTTNNSSSSSSSTINNNKKGGGIEQANTISRENLSTKINHQNNNILNVPTGNTNLSKTNSLSSSHGTFRIKSMEDIATNAEGGSTTLNATTSRLNTVSHGTGINPFVKITTTGNIRNTELSLKQQLQSPEEIIVPTSSIPFANVSLENSSDKYHNLNNYEDDEDNVINLLFDDDDDDDDDNHISTNYNEDKVSDTHITSKDHIRNTNPAQNTGLFSKSKLTSTSLEQQFTGEKRKLTNNLLGETTTKRSNSLQNGTSSSNNNNKNSSQMSIFQAVKALQNQAEENKKFWETI